MVTSYFQINKTEKIFRLKKLMLLLVPLLILLLMSSLMLLNMVFTEVFGEQR